MARGPAKRVAVDIGSSAIKLCELAESDNGFVMTKFAKTDLRVDPSLSPEERAEIRAEGLREALGAVRNKFKKSVFAVPGQSVFVRNRELPSVPASKVADIVRYEITQQIPFPLRDIALDYHVLRRAETGEYDVMMVAIKVDAIDAYADVVQDAKLKIDTVDVGPIAAFNWMNYTGEFSDESETTACIDFGAATTDIFIVKDGFFRFTRSLTLAGNQVSESIKNELGCTFLEAERLKIECCSVWPEIQRPVPQGLDPKFVKQANDAMPKVVTRMVDEIRRSIAFFRSLPEGGPVTKVLITGGGAGLAGLVPFIQDRLRINAVEIYNPLKGAQLSEGIEQAAGSALSLTVPLGLALRNHTTPNIEINLIPPRIIEAEQRKEQAVYWGLSFATMMLIAASVVPLKAQEFQRNTAESAILDGEINMYMERDAERTQIETTLDQLTLKIEKARELNGMRWTWIAPLLTVRSSLPGGVWLASMRAGYIGDEVAVPVYDEYDEEEEDDFGGFGGYGAYTSGGFGFVDGLAITPAQFATVSTLGGYGSGPSVQQLPLVNTIQLIGYAPNFEKIEKLVEQVTVTFEEKGLFKELKFEPREVVEMDRYNLETIGTPGGGYGGGGGGYDDEEEDEDYGGFGGGYGGYGGYGGRGMQPGMNPRAERDTVWQFTMCVVMY